MSGHHARPGPQPRHTAHPAIQASRRRDHPPRPRCMHQHDHHEPPEHGTGHAQRWLQRPYAHPHRVGFDVRRAVLRPGLRRYYQQHPAVTISYSAVGSSAGIAAFSARQVDFGASDVPMTASEQAAAQGGPVVQVPVDLGAEGVVYNLDLPAGTRLHLTGPVIARIFLGQITSWHDPAITALNPGINLPSRADHRRPPLRRQRHHLHLQQLPVQRRPHLGGQGRHRQDA